MSDARLGRLLRVLMLLQSRTARRPSEIAEELAISKRTVFRDIKALSHAGAAYHFDKESGRYRITGDFFLPPLHLTLAEALAMSILGSMVGKQGRVPLLKDAWQAITKIRSQLPEAITRELTLADDHVHVQAARVSPQEGCNEHFAVFRKAINGTRKVKCKYAGGKAEAADKAFLFRPYALFFCQRAWYVIGHSDLRGKERSLKLNRVTEAVATDHPYAIPDGWTLQKSLGNCWRMIGGPSYKVVIRFDGDFGKNVADTLWHPTQTIERLANGAYVFRCEVDGLDEITWWVLGYGPHATVIEPPELRRRIQELSEETIRNYNAPRMARRKEVREVHLSIKA